MSTQQALDFAPPAYRYGCGALVDTSAPVEVVPADLERGQQREHVYRGQLVEEAQ